MRVIEPFACRASGARKSLTAAVTSNDFAFSVIRQNHSFSITNPAAARFIARRD